MSSTPRRRVRTTAARGQGLRGWCPRDDHVYPFGNGICPRCGTSLVSMDPLPSGEHLEVIEHGPVEREPLKIPAVRSPLVARAALIGLVLAAFLIGLFFPRGEEEPAGPNVAPGYQGSQSVAVGRVVSAPSGSLLLSRLTQDGREFSATISVQAGPINPDLVTGAAVEVETEGSTDRRTIAGVSDVKLTHHLGGFSLIGKIPAGMGRIVEFRVASLQLRVPATPTWEVDLSGVWPVDGREPRVRHVGAPRKAGGEALLDLVAILAWHDRIEADFALRRVGTVATASVDGIEMTMNGEGDGLQDSWRTTLAARQEQISPLEILARFEGIPESARRVTIRVTRVSRVLWGPWSWRLG